MIKLVSPKLRILTRLCRCIPHMAMIARAIPARTSNRQKAAAMVTAPLGTLVPSRGNKVSAASGMAIRAATRLPSAAHEAKDFLASGGADGMGGGFMIGSVIVLSVRRRTCSSF